MTGVALKRRPIITIYDLRAEVYASVAHIPGKLVYKSLLRIQHLIVVILYFKFLGNNGLQRAAFSLIRELIIIYHRKITDTIHILFRYTFVTV